MRRLASLRDRHIAGLMVVMSLSLTGCDEEVCEDGAPPRPLRTVQCDEAEICHETEAIGCPCTDCPTEPACPTTSASRFVEQGPATTEHVVDGQFTGDEWANVVPQEGLFTDVYLDYSEGRLYLLNDWHRNVEGIRPDCFNYFRFRVDETVIEMWVYGDHRVEVKIDGVTALESTAHDAQGAYGFGTSPLSASPHTIYELSIAVEASIIDVCCLDPITNGSCDFLSTDPVTFSIDARGGQVRVGRVIGVGLPRLGVGEPCGDGASGVCDDPLTCEIQPDGGTRRCAGDDPSDGGTDTDAGEDAGPS